MRCSATVVLPEPAPPWMTTRPVDGSVMSSNCARSMSAAISGSVLLASCDARAGSMRRFWPRALRRPRSRRSRRGALAAGEQRHLVAVELEPFALARRDEGALRAADAPQLAAGDGDVAPRLDDAAQRAAGDLLVVVVALVVAVVDLRHRRVAPVDDLHAGGAIDEPAPPDQDVLLARRLAGSCPRRAAACARNRATPRRWAAPPCRRAARPPAPTRASSARPATADLPASRRRAGRATL